MTNQFIFPKRKTRLVIDNKAVVLLSIMKKKKNLCKSLKSPGKVLKRCFWSTKLQNTCEDWNVLGNNTCLLLSESSKLLKGNKNQRNLKLIEMIIYNFWNDNNYCV